LIVNFTFIIRFSTNLHNTAIRVVYYTGWSKSLWAPDGYNPHTNEDGHHTIHSECGPCCTEHDLREHSSACQ